MLFQGASETNNSNYSWHSQSSQRRQGKSPPKTLAHEEKMEETLGEDIQRENLPPWMSKDAIENNET